jgi:hypothetical protein
MWSEINRRMARLTYREIWPKDEPKPVPALNYPVEPAELVQPERRVSPARWKDVPKTKLPADATADDNLPF